MSIEVPPGKKIYFLSDFHLGSPDPQTSSDREKRIVSFLQSIKSSTATLFVLGDMFDFWYEYRKVVPRGGVRLLAALASFTDEGIPVHFFVGNHDMWVRDYFSEELGMKVYYQPQGFRIGGKSFFIGHGDGLGPGDQGYKAMKKVFRSKVSQTLFGLVPPVLGVGIANYFSNKSREATGTSEESFLGEDREWLLQFSRDTLKETHYHFFVFGHRHLPIDFRLSEDSRYINLGEWINFDTYAEFDGIDLTLKSWSGKEDKIYRKS